MLVAEEVQAILCLLDGCKEEHFTKDALTFALDGADQHGRASPHRVKRTNG